MQGLPYASFAGLLGGPVAVSDSMEDWNASIRPLRRIVVDDLLL